MTKPLIAVPFSCSRIAATTAREQCHNVRLKRDLPRHITTCITWDALSVIRYRTTIETAMSSSSYPSLSNINSHARAFYSTKRLAATVPITKNSNDGSNFTGPLKSKTTAWLEEQKSSQGATWTRKDVALGRSLFNDWLRLPHSNLDRAPWAHGVFLRWVQECLACGPTKSDAPVMTTLPELMNMLHRVLFAWRKHALEGHHNYDSSAPVEDSMKLLNAMESLCETTNNHHVLPGPKAYSLVFSTLSLCPDNLPFACDDALALLGQYTQEPQRNRLGTESDLIVWNSCLHALAKCSRFHRKAPQQSEKLLESMIDESSSLVPVQKRSTTTVVTKPPRPDVVSFASVLDAWATSSQPGSARRAHAILDRMVAAPQQNQEHLPHPNTVCFNICIGAYAKKQEHGSAQHAQDLLDCMLKHSGNEIQPDRRSFVSAMKAWANCTEDPLAAEKAEALLEQLQELYHKTSNESFRPTGGCYAVVLDAWARKPNSGAKVESMLRAMEEELTKSNVATDSEDPKHGQSSIQAGYLAAIRAWGNTRKDIEAPEHAERLLYYMEEQSSLDIQKEIAPNATIYSAVIAAWSQSSRADAPERAIRILRRMQERNSKIQPDTVVFNSVLNVLAKQGDSRGTVALLKEMEDQVCNAKPDSVSYATVIHAFSRCRNTPGAAQQATELLQHLIDLYVKYRRDDLRPTPFAFSSAIVAWSNSGEIDCGERGEEIFWQMLKLPETFADDGVCPKPNTLVCNSVLRAWSLSNTGGAPDRAEKFLQWMHDQVLVGNEDVKPDIVSYVYVMRTWMQSRRASSVRQIEKHLNTMVAVSKNIEDHPLCPNASTYNLLLESIKNSSDNDRAQKCQLLLNQLVEASNNRKEQLYDLASFHIALMACLPSIRIRKTNRVTALDTVKAIFGDLKSANEISSMRVSNTIIETLLLVLVSVSDGDLDETFLFDVFKFSSTRAGEFGLQQILTALQKRISQEQFLLLLSMEEQYQQRPQYV